MAMAGMGLSLPPAVEAQPSLHDSESRHSLVNGQYMIVAREAYEAIGPHAAVRQYPSADVPLAYLAKVQGWTLPLLHGRDGLETAYTTP
jgi:hypothetical protein